MEPENGTLEQEIPALENIIFGFHYVKFCWCKVNLKYTTSPFRNIRFPATGAQHFSRKKKMHLLICAAPKFCLKKRWPWVLLDK